MTTYQTYHPTASACKTRHQHQPSLLKTSRSLSLERPRGSQKPTGAWSPTRPSKPQYAFASCRKSASAKFKYTAGHSSNLISIFSCFPNLRESYLKSSKVDTQEIQEENNNERLRKQLRNKSQALAGLWFLPLWQGVVARAFHSAAQRRVSVQGPVTPGRASEAVLEEP